jgi:hypothetical protein
LVNGRFLGKILFKDVEFWFSDNVQNAQKPITPRRLCWYNSPLLVAIFHVEDEVSNGIEFIDEFDCFAVPPSGLAHEPPERLLVHVVDCESDHCGFLRLLPDLIHLSLLLMPLPPERAKAVRLSRAMHVIWSSIWTLQFIDDSSESCIASRRPSFDRARRICSRPDHSVFVWAS